MTAWWRELDIGSRRDQLSLPIVAKQQSVTIAPLGKPGDNAREHPLLALIKHPTERIASSDNVASPVAPRKSVDLESISINVGVCVHNSLNETQACLASLLAARRPRDQIIVVDDASDRQTAEFLECFKKDNENITLIRHEQNQGYTRSANAVLQNSEGDWVILLNSDTVAPPRALHKLVACGEQYSQLGVVGPLSNAASWQTVPQLTGSDGKFLVNQIAPGWTIEEIDALCNEVSTGVIPFVPLINGFCMAIRRSVIKRVGLFDEKSFPLGYGEEDDFVLRAGAAGFLCGVATDCYVYHVKSATFTAEKRRPLVEAGAKALHAKHSSERIAAAVNVMKHHPELTRVRGRLRDRLGNRDA